MTTLLKVKNLTKKFNHFLAVDGISFEVGQNRVMGFLGPNGAGKTTTLRMMVGLSRPTSGNIEIAGQSIIFGGIAANHIFGYLPEQPSFYGWMTGIEFLSFIAQTFGIKEPERSQRIKKMLSLVDLADASKRKIATYSNGMKQRLGIAQALINDPKVLILDEPVSALDPIGRREVLNIIENLKKDKTIILSTHILSDVDRICDDIAIINKGKLIALSPLCDLKRKYAKKILEVEFVSDPISLSKSLAQEDWVEKYNMSGNIARIWPKSEDIFETNRPLKFFINQKIGIINYGLKLPETEDLFVNLIKESK